MTIWKNPRHFMMERKTLYNLLLHEGVEMSPKRQNKIVEKVGIRASLDSWLCSAFAVWDELIKWGVLSIKHSSLLCHFCLLLFKRKIKPLCIFCYIICHRQVFLFLLRRVILEVSGNQMILTFIPTRTTDH